MKHLGWFAAVAVALSLTAAVAATRARTRRSQPASGEGRLGYRLLYRLGIKPWDQRVPPELVALVEGPGALPPGRALDLGCGTGTQTIYLAAHGWAVTGVDFVGRALRAARRKAASAGVAPRFVQGDVSDLAALGIGDGFTLLLDYGCFHGLSDAARDGYVAGVAAAAAPGATFLLLTFAPGRRGPAPRGASGEEIVRRFGGAWEVEWARAPDWVRLPGPLRRADPTIYRLRRR